MDDIVRQAMAKWPNVPHCYGWLGLDARGNWYLRDDAAQSAGPFVAGLPAARGTLLQHEKLLAFIARNYDVDADGQWLFQNGPQCVYVELEVTPWIWRIAADYSVTSHTGQQVRAQRCFVDEAGWVYLETDTGFGLVHTQDVPTAANAIEAGLWVPHDVLSADLPTRFDFVMSPRDRHTA